MDDIKLNDAMENIENSCYDYIIHLKKESWNFMAFEDIHLDDFWIQKMKIMQNNLDKSMMEEIQTKPN